MKDRLGLFAIVGWYIWKARNAWVFKREWVEETQIIGNALSEFSDFCALKTQKPGNIVVQAHEVDRWSPPLRGAFKINVDGALDKSRGKGGVGIVVRDEMGQIVKLAAIPLSNVWVAEMVEALGFRSALEVVHDRVGDNFVMEGDAQGIIQMLQGVTCPSSSMGVVIADVLNLARLFHSISFSFVRRNFNRVAHEIAKYALSVEHSTTWERDFPDWVCRIAILDIS